MCALVRARVSLNTKTTDQKKKTNNNIDFDSDWQQHKMKSKIESTVAEREKHKCRKKNDCTDSHAIVNDHKVAAGIMMKRHSELLSQGFASMKS